MKKILFLTFFLSFLLANSQFKKIEKIVSDTILADDNHFLKNPFDEKFLLIGDFLPVKEGPKIKLAKVLTENGWGYINEKGKIVIPPNYFDISEFKNGLAKMTYLIPNQFDKFQQDRCLGFVNYEGKRVTPKCFRENAPFYKFGDKTDGFDYLKVGADDKISEDLFRVKTKGVIGIYNIQGQNVIPEKYYDISFNGKYFICEQGSRGIFDIYDKNAKLIRTIDANNVSIILNDFIIIRKNWKEHIENLLTGQKYLENTFNSINLFNYSNNLSLGKVILVGTIYEDGKYGKVKSTTYIDHNFEIIPNSSFPKIQDILSKANMMIAESADNKSILLLDFNWKILNTYEKKEYLLYQSLSSNGFQKTENLQENLKKYYPLWSHFSMSGSARDIGYYYLLEIDNKENNFEKTYFFIEKKSGEIAFQIQKQFNIISMFSNGKYLSVIVDYANYCVIDRSGKIIKTAKPEQVYKVVSGQLFIEENGSYYFLDKNFEKIPNAEFGGIYQIYGNSSNFVVLKNGFYGIANKNGRIIIPTIYPVTTFDEYTKISEAEFYGNENVLIIDLKSLKVIRKIGFKSKYFSAVFRDGFYYNGGPQYFFDENRGTHKLISNSNIIIDQYGNVVKITY